MAGETMLAALYRSIGSAAEVLEIAEIERPEPGPGEVRVRVAVSGVNPTDVKNRSGMVTWPIDGFQVPHHDGAGTIDAVGPGVDESRLGEHVWLTMAAHGNRWGTAAQWCVVPSFKARRLPGDGDHLLGATLGVPAVTAAHCLITDGPVGGLDVLRVLEVSLAANARIDMEVCDVNAVVVVFATDGGEAVMPVRPPLFKSLSFRFILLYNLGREELERAASEVERALDDGVLSVPAVTRFPLEQITAAHELQESGPFGRVLLDIP